ncbi:hypothetical protein [Nocardioides sp. SYSU DS0663]|uniref:hypothetical protein n=1 Tax=Nocardioides sp. SYSU DS0663 TaxID=3416445 RepID=UPI003F4B335D
MTTAPLEPDPTDPDLVPPGGDPQQAPNPVAPGEDPGTPDVDPATPEPTES